LSIFFIYSQYNLKTPAHSLLLSQIVTSDTKYTIKILAKHIQNKNIF